jgi:hypothetical protein
MVRVLCPLMGMVAVWANGTKPGSKRGDGPACTKCGSRTHAQVK